jgi:hypothetical protein
MIEQAIYKLLADDAAVGAIAADRISPNQRLQGTALPAVVYNVNEIEPFRNLAGSSLLTAAQLEVTAIADTYASARTLSEAVIVALSSGVGAIAGTGVTIVASRYVSETPTDTGTGEGEEDLPYEVKSTYTIHYTET